MQKLVMFVSCLEWVRRTDGTYETCRQMRNILKRVLDNLLAPTANTATSGSKSHGNGSAVVSENSSSTDSTTSRTAFNFSDMSHQAIHDDGLGDILSWPDCLDWTQAPWSDLPEISIDPSWFER